MTTGKYKFDAWLVSGRALVGLVECKWLSGTGFYGLNIAKYHQMTQLSARLAVPSYYACRTPGRMGYIKFHNGTWEDIEPTFTMAGGTPKGKEQNWDDIEPMAMFNERDINWIAGRSK